MEPFTSHSLPLQLYIWNTKKRIFTTCQQEMLTLPVKGVKGDTKCRVTAALELHPNLWQFHTNLGTSLNKNGGPSKQIQ